MRDPRRFSTLPGVTRSAEPGLEAACSEKPGAGGTRLRKGEPWAPADGGRRDNACEVGVLRSGSQKTPRLCSIGGPRDPRSPRPTLTHKRAQLGMEPTRPEWSMDAVLAAGAGARAGR